MLLDIRLKDGSGLELLSELRASHPSLPVIMAIAYGDSERTIEAMKLGAFDYLTKPFDLDRLIETLRRAVTSAPAAAAPSPLTAAGDGVRLVGSSARLVESELFGHEKGAFTGAAARREGRFEAAAGGTLFLDEIGDLDPGLQTKLLRVLQEGTFERVGSQETIRSTARIVAATSRPVLPKTPGVTLREDLFYRLAVLHIELPPLRERRSDNPVLVQSFLQHLAGPRRAVSEAAMACLLAHDWPGNVRELLHVLERASVMSASEVLDEADLALPAVSASAPASIASDSDGDDLDLRRATATLERRLIEKALVRSSGNRAEAARLLGIGRPNLYAKMRELGLS